ncbi:MAG: hypothetical protein ABI746_07315, partial [Dermatophilaceae bacterium]
MLNAVKPTGRSLFHGVATVTSARVLGLVLSLVQVKLAVGYLGPTGYGLLLTATLFINSLGAWTELGMSAIVVRRVSGRGQSLTRTVGLAMSISMLVVGPLCVGTVVVGFFMYRDLPIVVIGICLLAIGLPFSAWASCLNPVAQVTGRFRHYASAELIGRSASLAIIGIAVATDRGLPWFFVAQLMVPIGQAVA